MSDEKRGRTACAFAVAALLTAALPHVAFAQTSGTKDVPPSGTPETLQQMTPDTQRNALGLDGNPSQSGQNLGRTPGSVAPAPPRAISQPSYVPPSPMAAPQGAAQIGGGSR